MGEGSRGLPWAGRSCSSVAGLHAHAQCDDCVHSTHMLGVGLVLVLHAGFGLAQPGGAAWLRRRGKASTASKVGSQAGFIAAGSLRRSCSHHAEVVCRVCLHKAELAGAAVHVGVARGADIFGYVDGVLVTERCGPATGPCLLGTKRACTGRRCRTEVVATPCAERWRCKRRTCSGSDRPR